MAKTPRTSKPAATPAAPVPAPQPVGVLTLKQWRENPGYQARLRVLLDDPIFQHAHATLMAIAFPGVEPAGKAEAGVSAEASDQALARRYVHRSGFSFFPKMLRALTTTEQSQAPQNYESRLEPEDE